MPANPALLQQLIAIMQEDKPAGYFLNRPSDVYTFAQNLFKDIEDKRSQQTALTKQQIASLGQTNLQFSATKNESRINALYRLIGLPTNNDIGNNTTLLGATGVKITNQNDLATALLQREFQQLQLTLAEISQTTSGQSLTPQQLNAKLDTTQATLQKFIAGLFDPNTIQTTRLFPVVQYDKIQQVVEVRNMIAPVFATNDERYINGQLRQPPFLESVITIRLLQQSGGAQINTQGAVETAIIQALGYALAELGKRYHANQESAEKHLLDGIALVRPKVPGVNSAAVKKADLSAGTRQPDGITTEQDIRTQYTQAQLQLYSAIVSLLPTDIDVIPIAPTVGNTPFQARTIKDNAFTASFLEIINANVAALQRATTNTNSALMKRQYTQDKLTAELGSIIGEITGISLAEIIIVIGALFVMDEQDLVGLIPDGRYKQLISTTSTNNNTSTSSPSIQSSGTTATAQKQINIFNILQQFQNTRTPTAQAVPILQGIVKSLYDAFVIQLKTAHMLPTG